MKLVIIAIVLSGSLSVNAAAPQQETLKGDAGAVAAILRADSKSVNTSKRVNSRGDTLLHWAVTGGDEATVALLLAKGADPNAREKVLGGTPLHSAARAGDAPMIHMLLNHGADPSLKLANGFTAHLIALSMGHKEAATLLPWAAYK